MPHPEFDPHLLERYAEQLYRKADSVRIGSAIVGATLGVVFGATPLSPLGEFLPVPSTFGLATVLLGGLVGALTGYVVGESRAFRVRLQAQLVLFQLQLERNTALGARPAQATAPAPQPPPHPLPAAAPGPVSAPAPVAAPAIPIQPARSAVAAAFAGAAGRYEQPPLGIVAPPEPLRGQEEPAPPLLPPLSPR